MNRIVQVGVAVVALLVSGSAFAQSKAGASRVDFDDQLIQGQVNKGAVHLIERKDSDLGSLVKTRKSFRREILAGTGAEEIAKPQPSAAIAAIPAALPIVKATELKGEITPPVQKAPKGAPAAVPAPVVKSKAKVPAKKVAPAKKAAPTKKSASVKGGSNVRR